MSKKLSDYLPVLIDLIPDPTIILDGKGKIIAANTIASKFSGYKTEQLIGKNFIELDFISKESKLLIAKNAQKRLAGSTIPPYEIKITSQAGETMCLKVSGKRIERQGEFYSLAVFHDITAQNKIENQLKRNLLESEKIFNGITDSIKEAIIIVNQEAKVTYWNPAAQKIFFYTNEEALGKNIHEIVAPDSMSLEGKEHIKQSVATFAETGLGYFTVGNVELMGRRKDGTEFPVELSLSPMELSGKWNAVGVVKDITKRKQAVQKLKDAEQRYHALFNQAPLGVLVVDPQTASFVEFNDIAHLQLGYTREEFENTNIFGIEAKENPDEVRAHLEKMVKSGGGEFETYQKTKTGEVRAVLVITRVFQSNGKTFLHAIFRDITEIKKVENALVNSEARYRLLVELAQEGIWAIDNEFTTVFVNPRMAQMLGYTEAEMLGKKLFDFVDSRVVEIVRETIIRFKKDGLGDPVEYEFPRKDGTRIATSITMSNIKDDQGQITGTLAVMADITERKKAEKALKESEELSRAIVANAPIGIATSDSSHHFLSANDAFCGILGYTEPELRKLTFKEVTHPEDLQESIEKMRALESNRISYLVQEKRYIKRDGSSIVGRVIISAIRDSSGKPILFIAELEDITESKRLENDLRSSEERFRAISTSAMDAIILSDSEDTVIYWNPAAERTFGYTKMEAVGRKLSELIIPPQGHKNHKLLLGELGNQFSKRHFSYTALRRDRTACPIDLTVASVKLKDKNCLLSIVRDITEWKAMEEALRQERDMLESMATNIDAGLTIINKDYRIIWANQRLKEISGGGSAEHKFCYATFANSSHGVCDGCGVKKIFDNVASIDRRDYHFKNGDQDRWIELIASPVKDKEGKVVAALELAVDITERKRLQTKLAEYSQKLEELVQKRTEQLKKTEAELVKSERLAAIGELAGMIGHDLRNPLTGIKNSAYFLKKKGNEISQTQAKEMLETIDRCVDYSNKIVNDLLDYSREIRLEMQQTTAKKLLSESLSIITVPEKITVTDEIEEDCTVIVDTDKMKRVFINLLKNAVDAMPKGGTITVRSKQADDKLEISFSDTGNGITDEVLKKLFTPLFTTKAQGMGFGLAICKRVVEAHGGTITVSTVEGKGTTFTVTLPIERKLEFGGEKTWINLPESSSSMTMKL